jgi:uncharacterized protein YndB with AHSA1/START domain
MPTVSDSLEIAAPAEPVWRRGSDPRRYPEWVMVTDRRLDVPSDGLRHGATYRGSGALAPFTSESGWLVAACEPHRRQVHLGDDATVEIELTIEIEPIDGGSGLTQTLEAPPAACCVPCCA